jgi:hypothetical protein
MWRGMSATGRLCCFCHLRQSCVDHVLNGMKFRADRCEGQTAKASCRSAACCVLTYYLRGKFAGEMKLADFGLSRVFASPDPQYTNQVLP